MSTKFAGALHGANTTLFRTEVIDRTNIVETTASDKVARGSIGAGHDPRGAEGNGVDLVCSISVPDDEFSVLGGRDEMTFVCCPMHGINLGEMAFE